MSESRSPSSSGPVTRSLFSLKPPPLPRPANGPASMGPTPAVSAPPGVDAALEDVLLTKLRGAAQALPPSVAPTSVRAIRPNQLVRALNEALAPERRRFEEELARSRERTLELEAALERVQAERQGVDETRRVELPRLAALVDQERTRAEELEREREAFAGRVAELERELERREAQTRALESALPPEPSDHDDVLARVQQRLEAMSAAATGDGDAPDGEANRARGSRAAGTEAAEARDVLAPAEARGRANAVDDPREGGALVEALLSSEARAVRIAALEQRVAALTGEAAELPGADEPPAARAVVALLRASEEEARARSERVEARVAELLEVTRDLHGALTEERRRRTLVEGALRAAQARLAVLERREPAAARLPSFASVVKGDVGPLLDAVRDEARRRDEALDGRVQRLSLATRAALERMAEILDQALVAGLFDRDMPRLDPEALSAPLLDALDGDPTTLRRDAWRRALDALDADRYDPDELEPDEADVEEVAPDEAEADGGAPEQARAGVAGPTWSHEDDERRRRTHHAEGEDVHASTAEAEEVGARGSGASPPVDDEPAAARGDATAGCVAPESMRPPFASTPSSLAAGADELDDASQDLDAAGFVEHLDDEPEVFASAEELDAWFRPGRPGQSEPEREAEQLAHFELVPPPPPRAGPPVAPAAPLQPPPPEAADQDMGELEGLDAAQASALRSAESVDAERRRLEERVRDAERALESEVWRGLATHRELVSTRQRLEELEAQLSAGATEPSASMSSDVAPTLGGLEPIEELEPLRQEVTSMERAAVLSLDVEDRDTWVHWLLLEHDPSYQARRARAVRECGEAMRTEAVSEQRRDELLHWLEAEPPSP